jgi:CRISPR-associated protein Csb1
MSSTLGRYDAWLADDDGPAAIVAREYLVPVEGPDGVLFPATFASGDGFKGGYNIDGPLDGENVCLVDSIGSQANRIEPMFAKEKYATLVPQVVVKAGEISVNLLEAGHRAGDAVVRCTALQNDIQAAFRASLRGNAEPLAKISPTSLVFGVWDSRDTQAKLPRLIASTIRAFNVRPLSRSAQFVPAIEYVREGILDEPADKAAKDAYSIRGFTHVPATGTHGGVIASGGVRRDATLSLAALRLLNAGSDETRTLALRRYILGLALLAFTFRPSGYLRQGCNLVIDTSRAGELTEVYGDGRRIPSNLAHEDLLDYAKQTAAAFGIGPDRNVEFDKTLAKKDLQGDKAGGEKPGKKAKK